jgi:WD40 repeat protein
MLSILPDQILSKHTKREDNEIFALHFHPDEQILLASDVDGCIHFNLFDLEEKSVSLPEGMGAKPFRPHKGESCRCIEVPPSTSKIISGGSDCSVAVSTFDPKVLTRYKLDNPVNVVKSLNEGTLVLAGDDEGALTALDIRMKKKLYTIHEQEDYITSITPTVNGIKSIACTAGDGTLAVYDLRILNEDKKRKKERLVAMSDPQEDELICSIMVNGDQNLITGDANGVVGIWKQGYWGDLKDRLPLYQNSSSSSDKKSDGSHSIDGMKAIEDKKFLVATSDGIIRRVGLFPNEVEKIIGVHRNSNGSEIATISGFDCDVELGLVASSGGDGEGRIKFWSLNNAPMEAEEKPETSSRNINAAKASKKDFFSSL